jgi:hypothetical protein
MSTSDTPTSEIPSSSRLTAVIGESAPHLTIFTLVLLLLLYGYEIFNFSLSIDEEAFAQSSIHATVAQGRWAGGLLGFLTPWMGNMPMLSTVFFCAGLGVSSCVLARMLFRKHSAQWAFVGLSVSSPFWPHIAEFNPLAWQVGVGCVLLTLAMLFSLAKDRLSYVWAAGLLAFATGIYQSLYLWFLVLLCVQHVSVLIGAAPDNVPGKHQGFRWLRKSIGIAVGGLLGYVAIQKLFLAVLSEKLAYIQKFVTLDDWTRFPAVTFARTFQRCQNLLIGADPIYLGYGKVLTVLPLLGLLMLVVRLIVRRAPLSRRLLGGVSILAALGLSMAPVIMSGGTIPARAILCWIPVTAFLAACALSDSGRFEKPLLALLAMTLLFSSWVTVSLFYSDHIARQRDELLAARIMARVDRIVPDPLAKRIPFVVVGAVPFGSWYSFHKVEIFGTSFFEHVGGDPFRIEAYLHLLGVDTLEPHRITEFPALLPAIDDMPDWPAANSVAIVNGVLVIKLGPMQYFSRPKPQVSGTKLGPVQVTASQSSAGDDPTRAIDGDINTRWGAGGPDPQWIQFDLGEPTDVSTVLLDPAQTPAGLTRHEIYGGPSPDNLKLVGSAEGVTQDSKWLVVPVTAKAVRYLKVSTVKSPSWVSWFEIEIYK